MSAAVPHADRRVAPRFEGLDLKVEFRFKRRFVLHRANGLDFNRYGLAIHYHRAIATERRVFLNLHYGELQIRRVVGIVHNCIAQDANYRLGIRFRLDSKEQLDGGQISRALHHLENCIQPLLATNYA